MSMGLAGVRTTTTSAHDCASVTITITITIICNHARYINGTHVTKGWGWVEVGEVEVRAEGKEVKNTKKSREKN